MQDVFVKYIQSISSKFAYEETSEMGYRSDFEELLKYVYSSIPHAHIFHDAKAYRGNKPDFILLKGKLRLLYIEVKDIGSSLDKIEKSEQMSRYYGYDNLILSDYTEFRFYRNGVAYCSPIKIATYDKNFRTITPLPQNYEYLSRTFIDFVKSHKEPIRSANHLAKIMGGKAQIIRNNIRENFTIDNDKNTELIQLYETIKKLLVHDMTLDAFADMYAQTLVYGLFVARYHDKSLDNFTRQEALELIPNSNKLLRRFFHHIVVSEFDDRLKYIVDELCEVFAHSDVAELMKQYFKDDLWGNTHKGPDPVIHFYEDFLKEYDPDLRKKLGAYYTPQPVVQFIVRSVDHTLKKDFGLSGGLADTSKNKDGIHKVQVLDPACGTGTFISAVIRNIYIPFKKNRQEGRWPAYVHHDLLPRIYGFELMMASYTIAHLKLGIAFRQTGFWDFHRRLGIYLTNSLEEAALQQELFGFGLANSIAEESKEAAAIKNDKPIMVVMGNPPYSVSSSNKSKWIEDLMKEYKKNLDSEKNIQPLSDDYIKFIRFAEHFIEKNGSGIVAMITNNSFLDGIIHRQMRKHLLETFDDIYILDLHGSSKKKEKAPNGAKDENVFEIQQGVSINIFIRKEGKKNNSCKVHHADLYGKREYKFDVLNKSNIENIEWKELKYSDPHYFFVPKDFTLEEKYKKGFKIDELIKIHSSGIKTHRDHFVIDIDKEKLANRIEAFIDPNKTDNEIRNLFHLQDNRDWNLTEARRRAQLEYKLDFYHKVLYRPFDERWVYYSGNLIDFDRRGVARHMLFSNLNMILMKANESIENFVILASKLMNEKGSLTSSNYYIFPLYLYQENDTRIPNLNPEIVDKIEKIVGKVSPENIFDYIYAVLHSPSYREKYKEFLKIDFPRIPYPKDDVSFKKLVKYGTELRHLHLLESPKVNNFITNYPGTEGPDIVEKVEYKDGNVFINKNKYFGNVPDTAWNFYIGGYQPAQKWLKDRKGRTLTNPDLEHYQKMIVALVETDRIMKQIDHVDL